MAQDVATTHKLPLGSVLGRHRHRPVKLARHELWWRLRQTRDPVLLRQLSWPELGRLLGYSHSTVLRGARLFERRLRARLEALLASFEDAK
jgi:chromosomal replication initiation ATPase DnaA